MKEETLKVGKNVKIKTTKFRELTISKGKIVETGEEHHAVLGKEVSMILDYLVMFYLNFPAL